MSASRGGKKIEWHWSASRPAARSISRRRFPGEPARRICGRLLVAVSLTLPTTSVRYRRPPAAGCMAATQGQVDMARNAANRRAGVGETDASGPGARRAFACEDCRVLRCRLCAKRNLQSRSPTRTRSQLMFHRSLMRILRLHFDDITEIYAPTDILFAADHARAISAFLDKWPGAERVILHCNMGVSRSPGVALRAVRRERLGHCGARKIVSQLESVGAQPGAPGGSVTHLGDRLNAPRQRNLRRFTQAVPMDNDPGTQLLGRMSIDKKFHGELDGASQGSDADQAQRTIIRNSAGYVAIEHVTGSLKGRKGFVHSPAYRDDEPRRALLVITVVPDSGTGAAGRPLKAP